MRKRQPSISLAHDTFPVFDLFGLSLLSVGPFLSLILFAMYIRGLEETVFFSLTGFVVAVYCVVVSLYDIGCRDILFCIVFSCAAFTLFYVLLAFFLETGFLVIGVGAWLVTHHAVRKYFGQHPRELTT